MIRRPQQHPTTQHIPHLSVSPRNGRRRVTHVDTDDGQVAINAIPRGSWCSIEVADTGIGIDETELSMIFDDFKQLASAPAPGIGLGLAIVKRTANLLGLRLAVSSTPGKGSRFSVEVPTVMSGETPQSASLR